MISSLTSVFERAPEEEEAALPPITLGIDPLLQLLRNERRRNIINVLAQCGQLSVADAAEIIAAREYNTPTNQITSDQRKRLYVSIYQTHAPKLAAHGLVEFDKDGCFVAPTPLTHTADEITGALDDATVDQGDTA